MGSQRCAARLCQAPSDWARASLSTGAKHSTSRHGVREVKGNDPKKLRCWAHSSGQIDVGACGWGGSLGRTKEAKSEERGEACERATTATTASLGAARRVCHGSPDGPWHEGLLAKPGGAGRHEKRAGGRQGSPAALERQKTARTTTEGGPAAASGAFVCSATLLCAQQAARQFPAARAWPGK